MGLFDIFKRKKSPEDRLKNMPEAMQKAYLAMFPKGVADHDRQLDELCKHYGNKYNSQEIDSNLIFILTGYIVTGDSKTREGAIAKVLNRQNNRMTKTDVDYLYTFALSQHPKLSQLLEVEKIMDTMSSDGCDTDTIPGGSGPFGVSPDNPIPTKGVAGSYDYLAHLRDSAGNKITYQRIGTTASSISEYPIDAYKLSAKSTFGTDVIYISAYHKRTSRLSPSGYVLVDNNDNVISNGGTRFGIGQKCLPNQEPKPQLTAINYFGVLDASELKQQPPYIVEAENLNRRGFIASNNGNKEEAIKLLKEAIAKGSKNAVNSLFAVYHSADMYKEAYEFLCDCITNKYFTAASLYNLAIIVCKFDSRYQFGNANYSLALSALKKAMSLPDDGLESNRKKIQANAQKLYDFISADDLP